MSEDEKPYEPPPPNLDRSPKAPMPEVPMSSTPSEPQPPVSSVRITEDPNDEEETLPGGVAEVNPRMIAAVIDVLVASGIYWLASLILPDFMGRLSWVLWAGYLVTRDSLPFLKGQSVGKMAMKLKVEKQGGGDIIGDWQTALVRNVTLLIPLFPLVEAIVLFTREDKPEKGLRLGDEWAKTKVVVAELPDSDSPDEST